MSRNFILLALLVGSAPAFAQTNSNAVTQSEDAFGRAIGNERIGIYSNDEVRGFNPTEAGNNRLEGLYVDVQSITSPRLLDGSSIRVGYGARGTLFPAPTGIVDLRIDKFTGKTHFNAEAEWENYANLSGVVEGKIALAGDKLGLALGLGFRKADQVQFRNGSFRNYLIGASWLPVKGSEVTVFASGYRGRSSEYAAILYPSGNALPPQQPRKLQQTQPWAQSRSGGVANGVIVKMPLNETIKFEGGLFYTTRREPIRFVTLLLGVAPDGRVANHLVLAEKNNKTASLSGEARITKTWTGETLRHSLTLSLRGRDQDRRFGGQSNTSLGASRAGVQDFRPEPAFVFGNKDMTNVRQLTYGAQYILQSKTGSLISFAAQKANFRKSTDFANVALTDTISRDAPWLFSANGALVISRKLSAYGGYVRGLEESAIAPDIATNRNQAPPPLRTRQMDVGLRYALADHLALIGGVFEVKKPYYGVNAATRFENLGTVSNRGIELSLAGTLLPGLTLVAGGILVNPQISGEEVKAGRIGARPLGSFKKRGVLNLDWKPAGQEAWSFDLALDRVSPEAADRLNTFSTPSKGGVNVGARYRVALGSSKLLLRAQVQNALNTYGWRVNSSGGFTTNQPRSFYLQGIVDF